VYAQQKQRYRVLNEIFARNNRQAIGSSSDDAGSRTPKAKKSEVLSDGNREHEWVTSYLLVFVATRTRFSSMPMRLQRRPVAYNSSTNEGPNKNAKCTRAATNRALCNYHG
jgi:hypothetical protein